VSEICPGACCTGAVCAITTGPTTCTSGGGVFQAGVLTCEASTCVTANVTCCRGATCAVIAAGTCPPNGTIPGVGSSVASGASCTGNTFAGCCSADFNKSGASDVDDIFAYMNAWFSLSPYADITSNGANTPDTDDIFAWFNAWFSGCT